MPDLVLNATANAIAYAKNRTDPEVTPDDLLLGALQAVSKLGVASFGPITVDLSTHPAVPNLNGGRDVRPRYASAAVDVFEQASAIARTDTESRVRLVHILAALGVSDGGLIGELRDRYDFDDADWRAALVEWDSRREPPAGAGPAKGALLSVDEAAEALGVHQQTIRGYIRTGKLAAFRIAGERAIRVYASDLYGLLEPLEPSSNDVGD